MGPLTILDPGDPNLWASRNASTAVSRLAFRRHPGLRLIARATAVGAESNARCAVDPETQERVQPDGVLDVEAGDRVHACCLGAPVACHSVPGHRAWPGHRRCVYRHARRQALPETDEGQATGWGWLTP
jgi:hypothetical protein